MQNGRIGLLGMDTVVHVSKILEARAAAGLGHYAKLVAARINLERIDGAVPPDGLVTNRSTMGIAHDAVASQARRHIRTRLNHDYVPQYPRPISTSTLVPAQATDTVVQQHPKRQRDAALAQQQDSVSLENSVLI